MPKIVRYQTKLKGVDWEYFVSGNGRTLLLIPAFHSDVTRFKTLIAYLSQHFQVVLPHLPGISNANNLGKYRFSAANYAYFLNLLVKQLKLKSYLLAGFCYGATIGIRMLEQKVNPPDHFLIFEGIYDADFITLKKRYQVVKKLALRLGSRSKLLSSIVNLILHNESALKLYLYLNYRHEKDLNKVIKHQVKITKIMSTQAYIEVAFDIFNTHLSQEKLRFKIPTTLIYNRFDNLIDVKPTIKGMRAIFPNSEVLTVDLTQHSPAGNIDIKFVQELIKPLEEKLLSLKK